MPTDLATETERLRSLIGTKRTATAVAQVENSLGSKWEGVQSVALRVLGSWGDSDSIRKLRAFLETAADREYGWSIRGVAIKELARCVAADDSGWVLDYYFELSGVLRKHEFLPVVLALPPEAARDRLLKEVPSVSRDNRQAAMKAIGNMSFPDRLQLLEPFLQDSDAEIRRGAKHLYART